MSPEEVVRARSLRAHGYSARQIARVLGLPRAAVRAFMRQAPEVDRRMVAAGELRACLVSAGWSAGLQVDERFPWPDVRDADPDVSGLAAVLVARLAGPDKVTACGYLVDLYCLGVKDVIGPRTLNDQQHAQFTRTFFAGFRHPPIAAPLELAQQLVLGAARYARTLGFDPAPGFDAVRDHLGEWSGVKAIAFGRNGRPEFIQGPYDDAFQVHETLRGAPPGGPRVNSPSDPHAAAPRHSAPVRAPAPAAAGDQIPLPAATVAAHVPAAAVAAQVPAQVVASESVRTSVPTDAAPERIELVGV